MTAKRYDPAAVRLTCPLCNSEFPAVLKAIPVIDHWTGAFLGWMDMECYRRMRERDGAHHVDWMAQADEQV
jgi:hypothetical protein